MTASPDQDIASRLTEILNEHSILEGPFLPILQAVQAEWGYVSQVALAQIADHLNITLAEAHGVASFYHDLRSAPGGRASVKICRAEACQAMGANALVAQAQAKLGLDWHETSADGAVTLDPVFCLGLCACAPAAMVNGKLHGRVTPEKLDALLAEVTS
ncbi:MAG: formate dehydrogenase subunit gamma [Rhodobacteraceae bacterium]|nr:formate dehydrogenase subunit gamma [Paracoccaceae bacterium]